MAALPASSNDASGLSTPSPKDSFSLCFTTEHQALPNGYRDDCVSIFHSPDEVETWLEAFGVRPREVVKIVLLGGSGVGKSWLCNVIVQFAAFRTRTVTETASFACFFDADRPFVLCDTPALSVAAHDSRACNEAAAKRVFEKFLPHAPTVCLFVVRSIHGRVTMDVGTMAHVRGYLGDDLPDNACACIVNAIHYEELDESPDDYDRNAKVQIRAALGTEPAPGHWAFVQQVQCTALADYANTETFAVRAKLMQLISATTPAPVRPTVSATKVASHRVLDDLIVEVD